MLNKLKRCNYDPELFLVLKVPTRIGEFVKPEYVMMPDGTAKRDKNGKLVRKRRGKAKNTLEIKDEEDLEDLIGDETKPEAKKSANRKRKTLIADKSGSQVSGDEGAKKSS